MIRTRWLLGAILAAHAALLAWGAFRHSPNLMEIEALPAGIANWQFSRFDLGTVNPPLVRMVAALPAIVLGTAADWSHYVDGPRPASRAAVGKDFLRANGPRSFWLISLGRCCCIPFSLLGASVCFLWASRLYGSRAGLGTALMWAFSPNILGYGQFLNADVPVAALTLTASYTFSRWLHEKTFLYAMFCGIALGTALLAKFTALSLVCVFPVVYCVCRFRCRGSGSEASPPLRHLQACAIVAIAFLVVNAGYAFEGTGQRIDRFQFVSAALAGPGSLDAGGGNRFAGSWVGRLPVPLPANYLSGLDFQRRDLESCGARRYSFLRGEWRNRGWWYYYLYGLAIKEPIGTWVLIGLALGAKLGSGWRAAMSIDELVLVGSAAAIIIAVSAHTVFNCHFRYVLPALPFLFVLGGQAFAEEGCMGRLRRSAATAALACAVASSLIIYPHSMSYFNVLVGGPRSGQYHLTGSAIDWGQDLFYLKDWIEAHPEARPIYVAFSGAVNPAMAGIELPDLPSARQIMDREGGSSFAVLDRRPGWYVISVSYLHGRGDGGVFAPFLQLEPTASVGYSIYIYHIQETGQRNDDLSR